RSTAARGGGIRVLARAIKEPVPNPPRERSGHRGVLGRPARRPVQGAQGRPGRRAEPHALASVFGVFDRCWLPQRGNDLIPERPAVCVCLLSHRSQSVLDGDLNRLKGAKDGDAFIAALEDMMAVELTNDFWTVRLPANLDSSSARS